MAFDQKIEDQGIPVSLIPGLASCDFHTPDELMKLMEKAKKTSYTHEEIYGEWAHLGLHIRCDPKIAFDYASSVYSLEEWSTSLRHFTPVGNGVFRGTDGWGNSETEFFVRVVANRESGCVDHHCAWDQYDELYMRVHLRFLDAYPAMGKQGTMLLWSTYHHPYFDPDPAHPPHIKASIARPGRAWIGAMWPLFPAGHQLEANNLKLILEHRHPL